MSVTSLRIEHDLEKPLAVAVKSMRRTKGWLINEALRCYLVNREQEEQRWEETLEALEDIRMGRVVEGDKVHAWLESWGTKNEISSPKR